MSPKTEKMSPSAKIAPPQSALPALRPVTTSDIMISLKAGCADFVSHPMLSGFFGLFYALFGICFMWVLIWLDKIWMIIPAAVGFPLVAPFAAAGLYEISRRRQNGRPVVWAEIFSVMRSQHKREMGWMAFVCLFIFWVWVYQIRLWLALILQNASFSDVSGFLDIVFFTPQGWLFLAIGTAVGALLSAVLFSVTAFAMPLLLEREIDFVSAMLVSVRAVAENPVIMLSWAALISATMLLSLIPAFLGLIVTLPILGHTTWHLYQRALRVPENTP